MKKLSICTLLLFISVFSFAKRPHFKIAFNGVNCRTKGNKVFCETKKIVRKRTYITRYIFNKSQFRNVFQRPLSTFFGRNITLTLIITKNMAPGGSGAGIKFLSRGRSLALSVWSSKLISIADEKYALKQKFSHKKFNKRVVIKPSKLMRTGRYITFSITKSVKVGSEWVRAKLKYYITPYDRIFKKYGSINTIKRRAKPIIVYFHCTQEKIKVLEIKGGVYVKARYKGYTLTPARGGARPRRYIRNNNRRRYRRGR